MNKTLLKKFLVFALIGLLLSGSCALCHCGFILPGLVTAAALGCCAVLALKAHAPLLLENFFYWKSWVARIPLHESEVLYFCNKCLSGRIVAIAAGMFAGTILVPPTGPQSCLLIMLTLTVFNVSIFACAALFRHRNMISEHTELTCYWVEDWDSTPRGDVQWGAWCEFENSGFVSYPLLKYLSLRDTGIEHLGGDPAVPVGERAFVFVKEFWMSNGECLRIAQIARGFQSLESLCDNYHSAARLQLPE